MNQSITGTTLPTDDATGPIRDNSRFDIAGLAAYLRQHVAPFDGDLQVQQFKGGQSNPTYRVVAGDAVYVMRKKPAGELLASAHAIDREFRVMQAVAQAGLPVPHMRAYCADAAVIGQAFYVMDHVDGRVFHDRLLGDCTPAQRAAMHRSMLENLALLSGIDYRAVGLEGYGRPEGYVARQVARWSKQYLSSGLEPCPDMDWLIHWLGDNAPPDGRVAIVHGDYRLGNLIYRHGGSDVVAVLDWELSTIGDPLSDLAYNVSGYYMPSSTRAGMADLDIASLGIPSLDDYLADYCRLTGRDSLPGFERHVVFSMFRSAAISAGVYKRGLDGNGADATAIERGAIYRGIAEAARRLAERTASA